MGVFVSLYNQFCNEASMWSGLFDQEELVRIKSKLDDLENTLALQGQAYFPSRALIFNAFIGLNPEDVKAVIIGQDPYPNALASGLAFSIPKGVPLTSSLHTIINAVAGLTCAHPPLALDHGDLSKWKTEGVLLLNSSLTISPLREISHLTLWHPFIKCLLTKFVNNNPNVPFLLWGKKAEQIAPGGCNKKLYAPHPVASKPDVADKIKKSLKEANKILILNKINAINWCSPWVNEA